MTRTRGVKVQMNVMIIRDTLPNGHAPTHQISFTYIERQNVMARTTVANYLPLFDLGSKIKVK